MLPSVFGVNTVERVSAERCLAREGRGIIAAVPQDQFAPERIVVSNPPGAPARTWPLCPWPWVAVYSGEGSTGEEKNFKCAMSAR